MANPPPDYMRDYKADADRVVKKKVWQVSGAKPATKKAGPWLTLPDCWSVEKAG